MSDPHLFESSLAALDWPELLERLAQRCFSDPGRRALGTLPLAPSVDEARERMRAIRALLDLSKHGTRLPGEAFSDIDEALAKSERGAKASGAELYGIFGVLRHARRLRSFAREHAPLDPELESGIDSDASLNDFADELERCLDPGGEVADRASTALAEARERVSETRASLRKLLNRLLARHAEVLSGSYVAERDGRYVLPVRADAHYRVEGNVMGSSGSGGTLFVEPKEAVHLLNDLRVREALVEREIAKVLDRLNQRLEGNEATVRTAFAACVRADVWGALAAWGHENSALAPELDARALFDLKAARHPLLSGSSSVVANDLALGEGTALVVSGPNAGGKTVTLKTFGLFALMARAGVPLTCAPGSRVGFFEQVLAEVGDDQSLARSLSTFSAHVQKLGQILRASGPGSLVLLDEVAAGTDPEEGAALAQAVLEAFALRGASVVTTTHYESLKEFAEIHEALQNAAVGFDFARMVPTFRVTMGASGASSALAVAARYGLDDGLLERARALMPRESVEREERQRRLAEEIARATAVRRELEEQLEREQERAAALERETQRRAHDAERTLGAEVEKLVGEVRLARAELESARKRLKKPGDAKSLKRIEREVSGIASQVALGGRFEKGIHTSAAVPTPAVELHVGSTVRLRNGSLGTVLETPGRGKVQVRVGALKVSAPRQELELVFDRRTPARQRRPVSLDAPLTKSPDPARRTSENTLDLRGARVDEARGLVEAFVDRLMGEGEEAGFVLHGHGTGALKAAVREHLESMAWVRDARAADPGEGGDAFTVFWVR